MPGAILGVAGIFVALSILFCYLISRSKYMFGLTVGSQSSPPAAALTVFPGPHQKRMTTPRPQMAPNRSRGVLGAGLTKTEAEDLLDWLEANGYPLGELDYIPGKGFTVRC
jgi:hypothetical protein